jgi:RNA polymerase sigma-70 factor (ECF subfamily)
MSDIDAKVQAFCERGEYDRATALVLQGAGAAIYRFIAARVRDEDLAGDAFARFSEDLWRGMPRFAGRAPVKVWAFAIARNAAGQMLRKQSRERRHRTDWTSTLSCRIAEQVHTETREYLRTDFKTRFQELATRLTPEEQGLLVLRVNEQLSWDDIARVHANADDTNLKKEAARLRKRFQLVRAKLRDLAKQEGLMPDDPATRD